MTIDFDELAQKEGYSNFREYIVIKYYIPKAGPSVKELAEELCVGEQSLFRAMEREDLPSRNKGWPVRREGFYCEECRILTPLGKMYNSYDNKRVICQTCLGKEDD